jgi:hypothetical protein
MAVMKAPKYFHAMEYRQTPDFRRFPTSSSRDAWVDDWRNAPDPARRLIYPLADIHGHVSRTIYAAKFRGPLMESELWEPADDAQGLRLREILPLLETIAPSPDYRGEWVDFPDDSPMSRLCPRSQAVASRLAKHPRADRPATPQEIAWDLGLSLATVCNRITAIHRLLFCDRSKPRAEHPRKSLSAIGKAWKHACMEADIAEMEAWLQ